MNIQQRMMIENELPTTQDELDFRARTAFVVEVEYQPTPHKESGQSVLSKSSGPPSQTKRTTHVEFFRAVVWETRKKYLTRIYQLRIIY